MDDYEAFINEEVREMNEQVEEEVELGFGLEQ